MKRGLAISGLLTVLMTRLLIQSAAAQSYLPELNIAKSNDTVTVSWPVSAYYYVLEAATNLSPPVSWINAFTATRSALPFPTLHPGVVQIATNITEEEIRVVLPVTDDQQFFRLEGATLIPVFRFAIFYNALLEFSISSPWTLNGPVHANGPIYTGSSQPLTFNDVVTTKDAISSPAKNGQGPDWANTGAYSGNPASITNVPSLSLPMGTGIYSAHLIIEMPVYGEDPNGKFSQLRLYNQAQIIFLINNTTVTLKIQAPVNGLLPGSDPSPLVWVSTNNPSALSTNFYFLTETNVFTDQRENKTILATQIDVGKYASWIKTNSQVQTKLPSASGLYPTILYVADNRTSLSGQLSAIRLTNGIAPPVNGGMGFTVATPNPLYVWGHYNCTNASYLGTTNTTQTWPCALIADAITILSPNWQDSQSGAVFGSGVRPATSTTINAAMIAGNVPSTGTNSTQFSGGVQNLPRLLEDWRGDTLTLNTSLVNLYNSAKATNQFKNAGVYYYPPVRNFNFDQNFWNPSKLPPGTPLVRVAPGY